MTRARQQLRDALADALPDSWVILDSARALDEPDPATPVVGAVQRASVTPAPNARGAWTERFAFWVITPSADLDELENDLDDALELVFAALDGLPWLTISTAERDVYMTTYHAWRVDLDLVTTKQ